MMQRDVDSRFFEREGKLAWKSGLTVKFGLPCDGGCPILGSLKKLLLLLFSCQSRRGKSPRAAQRTPRVGTAAAPGAVCFPYARRILFHAIGTQGTNLGSSRHRFGPDLVPVIAGYL